MQRLAVFCGSSLGKKASYKTSAQALGQALVQQGLGLVYGGATIGLMGEVANTVLQGGQEVIGVMPHDLVRREIAHYGTDLRIVDSMHERKAMMAELSDGFIALPGGFGTFEELLEMLTWSQLGLHQKPCGLLNVEGYYDPLLAFVDHAIEQGFIQEVYKQLFLVDTDPTRLIQRFRQFQHPVADKQLG